MRLIKFSILLMALSFMAAKTNAQNNDVKRFEFELRAGLTTPVGAYHGGSAQTGSALGMEGRYNFKDSPWDCGLMLELTTARRGFSNDADIWQSNRTLAFAATGAYNFHQGRNVNPFAGIAIGIAGNDVVGDDVYPSNGTSLFFSPRIGVELFRHFRLTISSNISRKGYNNLQLSLGVVIGGGKKRK